jgi:hypothetical protein
VVNGQLNLTVVVHTNCDDGDPTTVDSYNPNIQQCVHQHVINDTSLQVTECIDDAAYVPNPNTVVSTVIANGFYTCANPSQICVNGSCNYSRDVVTKCFYEAPVGFALPPLQVVLWQTVYDDSKCSLTIPGKQYASCNPFPLAGQYSKTGCCQCGSLRQQDVIYYLGPDCVCCQSDADCEAGAFCDTLLNICELV